jgi:hypothetical protein
MTRAPGPCVRSVSLTNRIVKDPGDASSLPHYREIIQDPSRDSELET